MSATGFSFSACEASAYVARSLDAFDVALQGFSMQDLQRELAQQQFSVLATVGVGGILALAPRLFGPDWLMKVVVVIGAMVGALATHSAVQHALLQPLLPQWFLHSPVLPPSLHSVPP